MFDWLFKRLSEPSTYAGLGVSAGGLGLAFDINEAPAVAGALDAGAQVLAAGGSPIMGGAVVFAGIMAIFFGEKGRGR